MNYSIVVWGFDTDNDYYHDCDIIAAKSLQKRLLMLLIMHGKDGLLQK